MAQATLVARQQQQLRTAQSGSSVAGLVPNQSKMEALEGSYGALTPLPGYQTLFTKEKSQEYSQ